MFEIGASIITGVFTLIMWLLKSKDKQQEDQIAELFRKHDEDAKALQDLRVKIASDHYERAELDRKFDKLESAFREGFREMGEKFDRLSETLSKHIISGMNK